jgi:hypothetical protein
MVWLPDRICSVRRFCCWRWKVRFWEKVFWKRNSSCRVRREKWFPFCFGDFQSRLERTLLYLKCIICLNVVFFFFKINIFWGKWMIFEECYSIFKYYELLAWNLLIFAFNKILWTRCFDKGKKNTVHGGTKRFRTFFFVKCFWIVKREFETF